MKIPEKTIKNFFATQFFTMRNIKKKENKDYKLKNNCKNIKNNLRKEKDSIVYIINRIIKI